MGIKGRARIKKYEIAALGGRRNALGERHVACR